MMEIIVKLPSECSDQEINEFVQLVNEGGEVDPSGLEERVRRAKKLFFLSVASRRDLARLSAEPRASGGKDPSLVAVSAIKRFYQQYKNSIFKKAGCSNIASSYQLEVGWMYVKPASRDKGFGRKLLEVMINQLNGASCYTTVRSDNHIMDHLLNSHGFNKVGMEYSSSKGNHKIILYIKPN